MLHIGFMIDADLINSPISLFMIRHTLAKMASPRG